jgi:hypothetical protein
MSETIETILRIGRLGFGAGRQRMALERGTTLTLMKRPCSPQRGLQSHQRNCAGVAKRRRELIPTPKPLLPFLPFHLLHPNPFPSDSLSSRTPRPVWWGCSPSEAHPRRRLPVAPRRRQHEPRVAAHGPVHRRLRDTPTGRRCSPRLTAAPLPQTAGAHSAGQLLVLRGVALRGPR